MPKKYYAVRKGRSSGVFDSWDECKAQVEGYSGAEYRSFKFRHEAEQYLQNDSVQTDAPTCDDAQQVATTTNEKTMLVVYVDGSYREDSGEFSYGLVFLEDGVEHTTTAKFSDSSLSDMHNVAGEIKGAEAAMRYAAEKGYQSITLFYDYEGLSKWCTGEWEAKKPGTKAYKEFYDGIKENLTVIFKKVKGHSGDKYNDMADALAKTALGIGTVEGIDKTEKKVRPMSVYITRNKEKLQELLNATAAELWEEVQTHTIQNVGQQLRFEFTVNNKTAKLDIYQRADGTTTFYPTGRNTELSNQLRDALESRAYPTTAEVKSYSLVIGAEWVQKTVEFLKSLCSDDDGSCEEHEDNGHTRHTFNSPIGDKLTITVLSPGKILLQGKPLFLYNELISFVSHSPKVEMHDIIQATNEFVETKTDVDTTRRKLQDLMPNAYAGSVDDTIWKVFSPSMAMLDMDNELEDYSCCMFPALRALEGFLLFLLDEKNVVIDEKHNFGIVFNKDPSDDSKYVVIPSMVAKVADSNYVSALQDIYNYFNKHRHVSFHMNQVFIDTKLIEKKEEAASTIVEVAELIERTYILTHS